MPLSVWHVQIENNSVKAEILWANICDEAFEK